MSLNKPHIIRSSRLILAMLAGYTVAELLHINRPLWLFITLVVVLFDQSTVGGSILRGYLRVSATIVGALIGLLVLLIFHGNQIANNITILTCTALFAYFFMDTKYSYIGVIGSITIIMILSNDFGNLGGINIAIMRIIAILIGTIVAVISMIMFYPNYAKKDIIRHILSSLDKIKTTINIFTDHKYTLPQTQEYILKIESEITSDIAKFNRLADEMQYETRTKTDYPAIFLHIRRINRLFNIIFLNLPIEDMRHDIQLINALNQLAQALEQIRMRILNQDSIKISLPSLDYPDLDNLKKHDLFFTYATVNRIIHETRELELTLIQINI
jgi:hypothetical protein